MSIYATLWTLKFPKEGFDYLGCEWIKVTAQGVPPHIGTPTPGHGYDGHDPYAMFLPPAVITNADGDAEFLRAVVFVGEGTPKGTARSHQEYVSPLLILSGEEYARMTFDKLYSRICEALRGEKSRIIAHVIKPDGSNRLLFEDGTAREVDPSE